MIVFGGCTYDNVYLADTWSIEAGGSLEWEQLHTTDVPPKRAFASMAVDPMRRRALLFGGESWEPDGTGARIYNDLWELNLNGVPEWRMLETIGTPPAPRQGALMVHDPLRDRLILMGGWYAGAFDVWELALGDLRWRKLEPLSIPPLPHFLAGAYDPIRDRIVTNSGCCGRRPRVLSLASDPPVWSDFHPPQPWPEMGGETYVYDPVRDRMVVHGGQLDDAWTLTLGSQPAWSRLGETTGGQTAHHSLVYVPSRDELVAFGGKCDACIGTYRHDTRRYSFERDTWSVLPLIRTDHTIVVDAERDRLLAFGGRDPRDFKNDVWERPTGGAAWWTQVRARGTAPRARAGHTAVLDRAGDRMIVFGGSAPDTLDDLWSLELADTATWTPLAPTGAKPSPRAWHSAVYDDERQRMVVFGGASSRTGYLPLNDVWALDGDDTLAWTQLAPAGTPPPGHWRHAAVIEPVQDRMLVFSGDQGYPQALRFEPLEWTMLGAPRAPNPLGPNVRAYRDSIRARFVVTGNPRGGEQHFWSFPMAPPYTWTIVDPAGAPPPQRQRRAVVHDPIRGATLISGGHTEDSYGRVLTTGVERTLLWDPELVDVSATPSPGGPRIRAAFPNPAVQDQRFEIELADAGSARLEIFDLSGRCLKTWHLAGSGYLDRTWDGRDTEGRRVSPGVYFGRLSSRSAITSIRLVRLD